MFLTFVEKIVIADKVLKTDVEEVHKLHNVKKCWFIITSVSQNEDLVYSPLQPVFGLIGVDFENLNY